MNIADTEMDSEESEGWRRAACVCVLCGLPAAGKTTLSQAVNTLAADRGWRSIVIVYDEMIPGDAFQMKVLEDDGSLVQAQTEWKLHRQAVLQCIEQFLKNPRVVAEPPATCRINSDAWRRCIQTPVGSSTLDSSQTDQSPLLVLLDDNFYYTSMRYEVYQLARKYSLGFCQAYLDCDVKTCITRNQRRSQALPTEVIIEMAKRLEPPNPQKNLWEKSSISLDNRDDLSKGDIHRLVELISCALNNPLSPVQDNTQQKEADRLSCATSVVHQADQVCRRLVSEAMKSARENKVSPEHMKVLAADLNESKTTFLRNLRKQFLQGLPVTHGEDIDVENVVKRAVKVFDQDRKEIMSKYFVNYL